MNYKTIMKVKCFDLKHSIKMLHIHVLVFYLYCCCLSTIFYQTMLLMECQKNKQLATVGLGEGMEPLVFPCQEAEAQRAAPCCFGCIF